MKFLADGEKRLTNGFGIMEDFGDIPLDEILALGGALVAAATVGLAAMSTMEVKTVYLNEQRELTPADRQARLESLLRNLGPAAQGKLIESTGKAAGEAVPGLLELIGLSG